MELIEFLISEDKWHEFLTYKLEKSHLSKSEENNLIEYVTNKRYESICSNIVNGSYVFSVPTKSYINKSGSNKKRTVYSFSEDENIVLKFISFLLYKYDYVFAGNTYAFRRNFTVKQAFLDIAKVKDIETYYSLKLDISNYFNSININLLLPKLEHILSADPKLFNLLKQILTLNKAVENGEVISENRGAMAGTPISAFLANVYLMELDKHFETLGVVYARYSDDIIVFSKSKEELENHEQFIFNFVNRLGLTINESKVVYCNPNQMWTFLGFSYSNGVIDLSNVTLKKVKDKIRRKARAIYRWRIKNKKDVFCAGKVLIRVFNRKFFKTSNTKDLSWCKWFFPIINTTSTLKQIDAYLVQYIRYLNSGKTTKQNFNITYNQIKEMGFKSLVNEYYKFKESKQNN